MLFKMTKETCLAQINIMERRSGLHFSREQKDLYIVLRETCGEKGCLCDQQLLAEILSASDPNGFYLFTKAYPNIFHT